MTPISRRHFNGLFASASVAAIGLPFIARAQEPDRVNYAWANTTAVAGQTHHALLNTTIAEKHALDVNMIQMLGGPVITEAVVSGAADIGSVPDFNAVMVMAAGAPIQIVGHQTNFRTALLATKNSGIEKMSDLKGKQIYGLFGINAYLNAQEAVRNAGLTVGQDVSFVNIGTPELADAVRSQRIDAFFIWDPWVTLFENAGLATVLAEDLTGTMVLVARNDFVERQDGNVLKRLLRAHTEALFYASQNHELTNGWFRSLDPAKGFPEDVIERVSSYDPQWHAKTFSELRTTVKAEDIENMQKMAAWGHSERLLSRTPEVKNFVNTAISGEVDAELRSNPFDITSVDLSKNQ